MVDAARPALAILTRAPSSGGKRRLFQTLDIPPDVDLLRSLLLDTVDGSALAGVRRVVAVTPAAASEEVREMTGIVDVMSQPEGDLGERMQAVMAALFEEGASAVALIGSDVPHITAAPIAETFDVLASDGDALVLGPSTDGGYYLIGACRVPDVFTNMQWGTGVVLSSTVRAAATLGFRVHQLPIMCDVDTVEDLRTAVSSGRAARSAAWMRRRLG
jgi:rSAM/selenodomain-associated transferase 1